MKSSETKFAGSLEFQPLFGEVLSLSPSCQVTDAISRHPEYGRDSALRLSALTQLQDERFFFGQLERLEATHVSLYSANNTQDCNRHSRKRAASQEDTSRFPSPDKEGG